MPQTFMVVACYSCRMFQVHPVKKSTKFACKVCGMKQSVRKVVFRGPAVDCRGCVQQLNSRGHDKESVLRDCVDSSAGDYVCEEREELDPSDNPSSDVFTSHSGRSTSKWSAFLECDDEEKSEEARWCHRQESCHGRMSNAASSKTTKFSQSDMGQHDNLLESSRPSICDTADRHAVCTVAVKFAEKCSPLHSLPDKCHVSNRKQAGASWKSPLQNRQSERPVRDVLSIQSQTWSVNDERDMRRIGLTERNTEDGDVYRSHFQPHRPSPPYHYDKASHTHIQHKKSCSLIQSLKPSILHVQTCRLTDAAGLRKCPPCSGLKIVKPTCQKTVYNHGNIASPCPRVSNVFSTEEDTVEDWSV